MASHQKWCFILGLVTLLMILPACTSNPPTFPTPQDQPIDTPKRSSCQSDADCIKAGCSGTICQSTSEEQAITTCEWQEQYQCYQAVSCGCINNVCQWSNPDQLTACLGGYQ